MDKSCKILTFTVPFIFLQLRANKPGTNAIVMTSKFPEMLVGH